MTRPLTQLVFASGGSSLLVRLGPSHTYHDQSQRHEDFKEPP